MKTETKIKRWITAAIMAYLTLLAIVVFGFIASVITGEREIFEFTVSFAGLLNLMNGFQGRVYKEIALEFLPDLGGFMLPLEIIAILCLVTGIILISILLHLYNSTN